MRTYIAISLAIALFGAIGGAWWKYNSTVDERDKLLIDKRQLESNIVQMEWAAGEHERLAKENIEFTRKATAEKEVLKIENDNLRADVDSGKRKLRIKAICPAVQLPEAGLPGESRETYAELSPGVLRAVFNFGERLGEFQGDFTDCKVRLKKDSK